MHLEHPLFLHGQRADDGEGPLGFLLPSERSVATRHKSDYQREQADRTARATEKLARGRGESTHPPGSGHLHLVGFTTLFGPAGRGNAQLGSAWPGLRDQLHPGPFPFRHEGGGCFDGLTLSRLGQKSSRSSARPICWKNSLTRLRDRDSVVVIHTTADERGCCQVAGNPLEHI